MAKKTKRKVEQKETSNKRISVGFFESEKHYFGLDADASNKDIGKAIRKKFDMPEPVKHTKRKELKEALELPDDATQKEINEAMLKRIKEKE